jgi:hypothetical protein
MNRVYSRSQCQEASPLDIHILLTLILTDATSPKSSRAWESRLLVARSLAARSFVQTRTSLLQDLDASRNSSIR